MGEIEELGGGDISKRVKMGIRSCLREKQECLEAHFSSRCMICSFTDNYNEIAVFFSIQC